MKRGSTTKADSKMLVVWVPVEMFPAIDEGVSILDTDRSKFTRAAIREKLSRLGIESKSQAAERN